MSEEPVSESDDDSLDNDPLFANTNRQRGISSNDAREITIVSFGHKYGAPGDSHTNFNIQAKVPNPPNSLRKNRTGLDQELQIELFQNGTVMEVYNWLVTEICNIIKNADKEDEIIIGIGCHSGKHRSVAIVEKLALHTWNELVEEEITIRVIHRDITTHGENKKQKNIANARDKRRT
eukprot:Phypoly_transcript_20046.p1 GENE.Phypoly_transcript_20046~~Phypoly_transcript_20046.p1  ORF type:complete len:203 (+),score=33.86 Phypoly_transcript_20046:77-610(+)